MTNSALARSDPFAGLRFWRSPKYGSSGSKPLRKGCQPAITGLVRLRAMIIAAEEDYARPITRRGLRFLALTAVRPNELRRPPLPSSEVRRTSWINRELNRYEWGVRRRQWSR